MRITSHAIISCIISITTALNLLWTLPVAELMTTTDAIECFNFIQKNNDIETIKLLQINLNQSSGYHYETISNSVGDESLSTYLLVNQHINQSCQVWMSSDLEVTPHLMEYLLMTQQNIEEVGEQQSKKESVEIL